MIRQAHLSDAKAITEIYNHYVSHTIVTFEEEPIKVSNMEELMKDIIPQLPWLVFEEKSSILGYAYANKWKTRSAYRHSVESTVYLHPDEYGKGIGTILYKALVKELNNRNIHAVIGGISLPNEASITLHEKLGFEKIAQFKEVGLKFGQWIDVGYWELILKD